MTSVRLYARSIEGTARQVLRNRGDNTWGNKFLEDTNVTSVRVYAQLTLGTARRVHGTQQQLNTKFYQAFVDL